MSLVVLDNICLAFGETTIVDDLNLRVGAGDRIGLIGPNGSGKTTVLRLLVGEQEADKGAVTKAARVRVGYLPQELVVAGGSDLLEFILSSVPGRGDLDGELRECESELERAHGEGDGDALMETAERVADIHERIDHFERFYTEHEAARILAGLGFTTADHQRDLGEFSGGWQMRAVLAALLFQQPDLLLLDEPTNHLDLPSVAWFSAFLKNYKRAFFLISHDREFLNEQVDRIVSFEMEGVRKYAGNYDLYVRQRAEEEEVLENQARNIEREREHMQRFVDRFRAQATKARAVQSRVKALEKMANVETFQRRRIMRFSFPPTKRAVGEVVRVEKLRKAYGDHVVFPGLDLTVRRGEKIGIIGVNGAGKTTLLKMIAGELSADAGAIKIGGKVDLGYYAQHHADTLHRDWTVYEEVSRANPDATIGRVRSVLGAFLFSGDDVDKLVSVLSGGERARVALARLLINPGNVLLMDEPSNHLDLDSSESLANSLATFDGTLVFVSHNRSLIRNLATVIWNVEGGTVEPYHGTLDEYMHSCQLRREVDGRGRGQDKAAAAAAPPAAAVEASSAELAPSRGQEKERKRREAELRNQRFRVVGPLQKRIDQLERRIAKLEEQQLERSAKLSDADVYADDKRRNKLLNDYQKAAAKLEELSGRWEVAVEELDAADAELARESAAD